MEVHNFSSTQSIYNQYLNELRNIDVQNDRMRFRRNLERIGEISAYEISKHMDYQPNQITTPLGVAKSHSFKNQPVLATVLRAGLPLHLGLLNYFDRADNCFISAYRKHSSEKDFEVEIEYMASPNLNDKTVILNDPMLASGKSMVLAYRALLKKGKPAKVHIVAVIASKEGVAFLKKHLPSEITWR